MADAAASAPEQLADLKLKQVKPAAVVDRSIVPAEDVSMAGATPVAVVPGGKAMVATARAFGAKSAKVAIAAAADGSVNSVFDIQEDGFEFGMLFSRFSAPGSDLFIFDDVKVILKRSGGESSIIFSGVLRMGSAVLKPFQKLVSSNAGLLMGGTIELDAGESIRGKIKARAIQLTSAAKFHLALTDDIVFSDLELTVDIARGESGSGWQIAPTLTGNLQLSRLAPDAADLACEISYQEGTLHVSGTVAEIDLPLAGGKLPVKDLSAAFDVGKTKSIELAATFAPGKQSFALAGALTDSFSGLYASGSSFTLNDVGDIFEQLTTLPLGLPDFGVEFSDVTLSFATADCKVGGKDLPEGIAVSGSVVVHGHTFTASALIQPNGVAFSGSMDDLDVGPVCIVNPRLEMQIYSAASGKPSRFAVAGSAKIEGVRVDCKLIYQRGASGGSWNAIVYGALDASSFGLSKVIPKAKGTFVDSLRFSKVALIYASEAAEVEDADFGFEAKQGLQLLGELEGIPALKDLTGSDKGGLKLSATFGSQIGIGIEMPESTRLELGSSVSCDPFKIEVLVLPVPELDLIFGMDVAVPKQAAPLHFDLKLAIGLVDASASATMLGYWIDPFGVSGLKIGPELALELGINYAQFVSTGTPSKFGFVGGLAMGDVVVKMAVSISTNPADMILYGELAQLTAANLIAFANDAAKAGIPADAVPDFFELNELKLYCAPAGGSIGTVTFDPGFSFACDLVLFGKSASCYFRIGDDGVVAKGGLDRLEIGPLTIGGRRGGDMVLDLELTREKQSLLIDAEIDFLGNRVGLYVNVSNQGIEFEFEQSFMGLMSYTITGISSGSLARPATLDFALTAEFDNQLTEYLRTTVTQKIDQAISVVETDIDAAQKKVSAAEAAYKKQFDAATAKLAKAQAAADRYLKQLQAKVAGEKAKYLAGVKAAKAKLAKAKAAYDKAFKNAQSAVTRAQASYDAAMRKARADVNRAERQYTGALNQAQADVARAQREYNNSIKKANADLNAARRNVNSLKSQRDSAAHELKHLPWTKAYKAPYLAGKVASLETAIGVANGVLSAAQAAVNSVGKGAGYVALQTAKASLEAVKQGGKSTAFESAKQTLKATQDGVKYGVLETAKKTLAGIQQSTEYTAWEAAQQALTTAEGAGRAALTAAETSLGAVGHSALYVAVETATAALDAVKTGTAAAAFDSAKVVLEGARQSSAAMLNLAKAAAAHSGDLLEVKHVKLSASLKAIERGEFFKAEIDAAVLGKAHEWSLDLDVNQVGDFIDKLFKGALNAAKKLVA